MLAVMQHSTQETNNISMTNDSIHYGLWINISYIT